MNKCTDAFLSIVASVLLHIPTESSSLPPLRRYPYRGCCYELASSSSSSVHTVLVVVNCEGQAARAYNFVESCISSFLISVVFVFKAFKIFNCCERKLSFGCCFFFSVSVEV